MPKTNGKKSAGKTSAEPVFRVTQEAVERFAGLTGDRSSLHMDSAFALRSMYRRTVVHGMLPVTFLIAAHASLVPDKQAQIVRIAARFLKPVFVDDRLSIAAKELETAKAGTTEAEYTIKNVESGAVVTTAYVISVAGNRGPERSKSAPRQAGNEALLSEPLTEQEWQFGQIAKGQQAGFGFRMSAESLTLFRRMLTDGLDGKGGTVPEDLREAGAAEMLTACWSRPSPVCACRAGTRL